MWKQGDGSVCDPTFSSWGVGSAVSPPAGSGAESRRQTHFGKTVSKIGFTPCLSVAVYTPNSDKLKCHDAINYNTNTFIQHQCYN